MYEFLKFSLLNILYINQVARSLYISSQCIYQSRILYQGSCDMDLSTKIDFLTERFYQSRFSICP